ncbi:MAG: hypothetical protein WD875_13900 [Pirellulales bacterium]
MVEPNLTDVPCGRLGDIDVGPNEVDVELLGRSPAKALERLASFGDAKALGSALGLVPSNGVAAFVGNELVVSPFPLREAGAQVTDLFAVDPHRLFAVRLADVVHLDHHLNANPPPPLDFEALVANEAVAPGLAARRAAAHFAPVRVEVPSPGVAERLDAGPKRLIARRRNAGLDARPAAGRVVAADAGAEVMDRPTILGELDVKPREYPFLPFFEPPIQVRPRILAADVCDEQRLLAFAAGGNVVGERHAVGIARFVPAASDGGH